MNREMQRWLGIGVWVAVAVAALPPASAASASVPTASLRERVVTLADGLTFTFVEVPAGGFVMGSPELEAGRASDEGPQREVTLPRPYWIGKYEVTQAQWREVMKDNPATFRDYGASPSYPVEGVSWLDAQEFIARLGARGVGRFRLPTEAEWEYAARAGTTTRYHTGDSPESLAGSANVFDPKTAALWPQWRDRALATDDGHVFTAPVGSFAPNACGLHDMHGNVWEWTADWHAVDWYARSPASDPTGPRTGDNRVRRGGSWHTWPFYARCSYRNWVTPQSRYTLIGFRLLLEAEAAQRFPQR